MDSQMIITAVLAIGAISIIMGGWYTVKQQSAVIIQRFGKFQTVSLAGFHFKIPVVDKIAGKLSLKTQQLDVKVETKTKDDVFVHLQVSVQYMVLKDKVFDAFYKLESPKAQINSYVFDTVRAEVPKMKLDEVFERKDDIAIAIRHELQEAMDNYGYDIVKALVTDIDPDSQVKIAMNRINASEREKIAAQYEADAEKIKIVAKAEAEAENKKLQGKGIADQRREIAKGLEESVDVLRKVGIDPQEASALLVIVQHYDTLLAMGESASSSLVLLPSSPATASNLMQEMVTAFTAASKLDQADKRSLLGN
jgi:regulator of protease activity HflC (stomatin/prohibitin superfamily)